ncbi:MAG: hypothetical protein H6Q72_1460 [Firmicutes bacterium]|nr:hypothetical protein [Bacillota bacterium]
MIQDEISSIAKFCYDKNPVKIYFDRIPQNMIVPCMYFPEPVVVSSADTICAYLNVYQLFIKAFALKTQDAHRAAHTIAEAIRKSRGVIPVINQDGTQSGGFMQINMDIETKPLDEGVAQLSLKWKSRYWYERETQTIMGSLKTTGWLKE